LRRNAYKMCMILVWKRRFPSRILVVFPGDSHRSIRRRAGGCDGKTIGRDV
jgi:hypothetical protein